MLLLDVNVLIYAHREGAPEHARYRQWLERVANGDEPFSVTDLVFAGFLRIVTHPRVLNPPTPLEKGLAFIAELRNRPNFVSLTPGLRHWEIFVQLCRVTQAKGNLIPDAFLAAFAIETGSLWVSTDRDYARFPGFRWQPPFRENRS